jgi:hypothetical protein
MRAGFAAVLVSVSLLAGVAHAGCLTGAAVGGVAGHYMDHHGLLGAAAGCAIGHHEAVVKQRQQATQAAQPSPPPSQQNSQQNSK